jgi:hypothetical protein
MQNSLVILLDERNSEKMRNFCQKSKKQSEQSWIYSASSTTSGSA